MKLLRFLGDSAATPRCTQHREVDQKYCSQGKNESVINMFSYRIDDIFYTFFYTIVYLQPVLIDCCVKESGKRLPGVGYTAESGLGGVGYTAESP